MAEFDIDVCMFDCYGTLIDWEGGIGAFLYDLALRRGETSPPAGGVLRTRWEAIQFELIQGAYARYASILAESLRRWCEERGYAWDPAEGRALARSMRCWQPFHDTVPALRRAQQAGLKLVIISNTDRDIIAHSVTQMGISFDEIITAEDARAYKPNLAPFELALSRINAPADRVLHIAFGFQYDIGPARRLGIHSAWVNRAADPMPEGEGPDYTWRDLWGLAAIAGQRYA
jgi:2-haloalkanoic acid dehalogenase type II